MRAVFSLTLFLSACLLFTIQLYFAKMVVPVFGGVPAVWNTCMLFFQFVLLAGYLYSHLLSKYFSAKKQFYIHLGIVLIPLFLLPVKIPSDWNFSFLTNPTAALLGLLFTSAALPFFVISTTAPLLQKWFSYSNASGHQDPYFLYSASNAGSLIALLSYPFLIEPTIPLLRQSIYWAYGYAAVYILILTCIFITHRRQINSVNTSVEKTADNISFKTRLGWAVLAFFPSSLMYGLTAYIATDIASIPLIWIAPLSIYLLTFIFVFAKKEIIPHEKIITILPFTIILISLLISSKCIEPIPLILFLHLGVFFLIAMFFHGKLAKARPSSAGLTEFYVWMSVGGIVGGVFNTLVTPALFKWPFEYPLILALACFFFHGNFGAKDLIKKTDLFLPLGIAVVFMVLNYCYLSIDWHEFPQILFTITFIILFGVPAVTCIIFRRYPFRFALFTTFYILIGVFSESANEKVISRERSFFGSYKITERTDKYGELYRRLYNGSTIHGIQKAKVNNPEALSYYHQTGPIGDVFKVRRTMQENSRVAVIGLGVGSLMFYSKEGDSWDYYEIDPISEKIALNNEYFGYLKNAKAPYKIILGDGRLSIKKAQNHEYEMIIVDAFSSDSIPTHLLTKEAIELYILKLKENGLLVLHISNRHLKLAPVLESVAKSTALKAIHIHDVRAREDKERSVYDSEWVVMAENGDNLNDIMRFSGWNELSYEKSIRTWTDDFSNILSVF